jgi:predicted hotdog family 3-hydroxylacyl-ACP dehydratase
VHLTRDDIARMIPHSGSMCLLDGVVHWDERRIRCFSRSHRDAGNPMRVADVLPALCGIEYAAQAMATHGGLAGGGAGGRPRAGYLASLRDVVCHRDRLDDLQQDLIIEAERLMGDEAHVVYRFTLRAGGLTLLSGRAAVSLDAGRAAP